MPRYAGCRSASIAKKGENGCVKNEDGLGEPQHKIKFAYFHPNFTQFYTNSQNFIGLQVSGLIDGYDHTNLNTPLPV